jgi:hypothetical protein
MNPFDFTKAISETKKDVIRDSENPQQAEKLYKPFLTNRALSYHVDSILYCNELNLRPDLDNLLQFDYLLNSIRKGKRYSKWHKPKNDSTIMTLSEYYGCSLEKAKEISKVLTTAQKEEILSYNNKGGITK